VRLIHWIIEYQAGSSETEQPCDRFLRETMNDCRAANCDARSDVRLQSTRQALRATGHTRRRGLTSTPRPTFTRWSTRATATRTSNSSLACSRALAASRRTPDLRPVRPRCAGRAPRCRPRQPCLLPGGARVAVCVGGIRDGAAVRRLPVRAPRPDIRICGHGSAPATPFSASPVSLRAFTSQRITLSGQWPVEQRPGFGTDGARGRGSHDTRQHRHSQRIDQL
jgi:hypothetical protein